MRIRAPGVSQLIRVFDRRKESKTGSGNYAMTHPSGARWLIPGAELGQLMKKARLEARRAQREIAGAIVARYGVVHLVSLPNVSRRPGSFALRRSKLHQVAQAARKVGASVVGTFHSHIATEAKPGPRDIREAENGSLMLICDTIGREWRLWRIKDRRAYALRFRPI